MDINALTQEIADSLKLEEEARRAAAAGIPPPDAQEPGGAEISAIAAAKKEGERQLDFLDAIVRETEEASAACEKAADKTRRQRQNAYSGAPPKLNLEVADENFKRATAAFNQFRTDNDITWPPSEDDRRAQIMWGLVIAILEGAFTCRVFLPAFGGGLVEAFFAAVIISFINVAFAFIGGAACLRYAVNHCNPGVKLGGLCGFFACLAVCAATVALSAWFRGHVDLLSGEDMDSAERAAAAWTNALASFRAADFWGLFSTLNGFLLVALGALCGICGVWKGYKYDDPYPRYGEMWRQKERAEERYNDAKEEHDVRMKEWRNSLGGGIKAAERELEKAVNLLKTPLNGMNKMSAESADLPDQVAQLAHGLLSIYRVKNSEVRAEPKPSYFARYPSPAEFPAVAARAGQLRQAAKKLRAASESVLAECAEEGKKCREAIAQAESE